MPASDGFLSGAGFFWLLCTYPLLRVLRLAVSPLRRVPFSDAKKEPKGFAPASGPRRLGFLRSGIDPGAAATVCCAAPPSAVYDFVVRSLRSHARINPSAQPSDVAGDARSRSRSRSRALELTLIVEWLEAGGWLGIGGVAAPHPSPLPREREPIFGPFKICIRLGISRWRISTKPLGQFPLPPGEG